MNEIPRLPNVASWTMETGIPLKAADIFAEAAADDAVSGLLARKVGLLRRFLDETGLSPDRVSFTEKITVDAGVRRYVWSFFENAGVAQ